MKRILETELMIEPQEISAYANADFEEPHSNFIDLLKEHCGSIEKIRTALDLGCGPGDITFRFTRAFTESTIDAVDGSREMLESAKKFIEDMPDLSTRINYVHSMINDYKTSSKYDLIYSNSVLHHLPDPMVIWNKIRDLSTSETKIFIMDLIRPDSIEQAMKLRDMYVSDEPDILRDGFYNSLLAAFEIEEVKEQLLEAGLNTLEVKQISDRHLIVFDKL